MLIACWIDFRRATRRLWHRRGATTLTALTLALGIGATTILFSLVDAAVLRPLPWPDSDRLVAIHAVWPERRGDAVHAATWDRSPLSWAMWQQLRDAPTFDDVGVWAVTPQILVGARDEVVPAIQVSSSLLALLGTRPALGRLFTADEDRTVSNRAILTHDAWHRHFGGRPDIVGQRVGLKVTDASAVASFEIIGVLAPDTRFYRESPGIILPVGQLSNNANYPTRFLRAVGRLAPDATLAQARSGAEAVVGRLAEPDRQSARIVTLHEDLLGGSPRPLWLLFGGAGLLLLVACSSVAGLLLGEARARRHDIAIHVTLGATRLRILRQLTIEHMVLAVIASAAGLGLAALVGPAVLAAAPVGLMDLEGPVVSARVAVFALLVGLITPLLFGLVPLLAVSAVQPAEGLAQSGSRHTPGRRVSHQVTVTVQVALALVLITGAAMFGETMIRLTARPLGFDPSDVAVASVSRVRPPAATAAFEGNPRADMARFREFLMRERTMSHATHVDAVLERVSALPGVVAAAGAMAAPFVGELPRIAVRPDGQLADAGHTVHVQTVTLGYFPAMRIPIVGGRDFAAEDRQGRRVAIVSAELGRRLFGGSAVGRRILVGNSNQPETYEIAGEVGNVKQRDFGEDDLAVIYLFNWQEPWINHLIVRTEGPAGVVLPSLRAAIEQHGPELAVTSTTTIDERLAASTHEERFRALLAAAFGSAALLLAAVGLYSLTARQVIERRREIGVRAALGASPGQVRTLMLRQAMLALGMGLVVGAPAAYAAAHATRSLIFGVVPGDPHLILTSSAVLAIVAVLATILPAHRASRIDPAVTLRE